MRYIIDIDNVTADWDGGWRKIWNDMHPFHQQVPEASHTWNDPFTDTGLEPEMFWAWSDRVHLWDRLAIVEGASAAIDKLDAIEEGNTVEFATNRHRQAREATVRWMRLHSLDKYDLHFVRDKSRLLSSQLDCLVDDDPVQLARAYHAAERLGRSPLVVRFHRPWNDHVDTWDLSVDSWDELLVYT